MRLALAALFTLLGACSLIATRDLQTGLGPGGAGGQGAGGSHSSGGSAGSGGACDDCDDDGQCENLLTDSAHCGVCGFACATGTCDQGACLYFETRFPLGIAVDTTHVYFSVGLNPASTSIARGSKNANDAATFIDTGGVQAWALYLTDTEVHAVFPDQGVGVGLWGKVSKADVMMVDPVWTVDAVGTPTFVMGSNLTICAAGSTEIQCTVGSALAASIPVSSPPAALDVDGGAAFWSDAAGNVSSALPGAAAATLAMGQPTPMGGLVVHDGIVYFGAGDRIRSVSVSGGTVSDFSDPGLVGPYFMRANNTHVYWSTLGDRLGGGSTLGRIYRRALDGGADEVLYESVDLVDGRLGFLALDGESVWFTDTFAGRVMKRSLAAPAL